MKFKVLAAGKGCRVVARADDDATPEYVECGLEREFFEYRQAGGSIAKDVDRMAAVFDFIAKEGRARSTRLFHEADKAEGIYEFTKGDLRVYFSFVPYQGQLCVCSHAIRKKGNKAKSADKKAAARLAAAFRQAIADGSVELIVPTKEKNP